MPSRSILVASVLGLFLAIAVTGSVSAHRPYFEEGDILAESPWEVKDPTISTALYATLDSPGDVDYYAFEGKQGQAILLAMVIPQIEGQEDFVPNLVLLGPGLPPVDLPARVAVPEGAGALLLEAPPGLPTTFNEPFSRTSYWERQEERVHLPADGHYWVAVYHPAGLVGRYTFVIGDRERLGGDVAFPLKMRRYWAPVNTVQPSGLVPPQFPGGVPMETFRWILLIGSFALFGVSYVLFLTVHPLRMARALLVATLTFVVGAVTLVLGYRGIEFALAILLGLASALGGYALMARRVLSREDSRPIPELRRQPGDPGLGHTAVVYFTHGEPETYDPIGWINQFRELDEHKIRFVPYLVRPFFLYHLRKKYLQVGKSDHRKMHRQMVKALERAFRTEGDATTRFYLSFLDDNPRPDAAVIQALNEGAGRIIVAEVFLTISNHTAEGKALIEALQVEEKFGVPIHYTGPLYDSQALKALFVHRANEHLAGTDKSKVGILLVGHGQPDEWDREWRTETEQELSFRRDVLKMLEADGFKPENLSLAWMEFKEPKPARKVEEFVRNGVERVLYFSAAISADAIHSQYDVPALVNRARVPPTVALVNLGAWNDDPIAIQAIKEKLEAQMH